MKLHTTYDGYFFFSKVTMKVAGADRYQKAGWLTLPMLEKTRFMLIKFLAHSPIRLPGSHLRLPAKYNVYLWVLLHLCN